MWFRTVRKYCVVTTILKIMSCLSDLSSPGGPCVLVTWDELVPRFKFGVVVGLGGEVYPDDVVSCSWFHTVRVRYLRYFEPEPRRSFMTVG